MLRYSRSSQETGIGKGEYARVTRVDAPNNRLTVERKDGTEQSYDPRRQQGVSVYREQERAFSVGDRVQLTAPSPDLKLANRELGTVLEIQSGTRCGFLLSSLPITSTCRVSRDGFRWAWINTTAARQRDFTRSKDAARSPLRAVAPASFGRAAAASGKKAIDSEAMTVKN